MHPPLFIIGNPRSGTTLLRLMLTNHKNILIPPECGFVLWFYEKYRIQEFSEEMVDRFINDLPDARKIETWNLDYKNLRKYILEIKPGTYSEMAGLVYEFYGHSIGRTFLRWGDKNNYYLNHIDTISQMYPDAFFVHIVRDGRDVACSYKNLSKLDIKSKYVPNLPSNVIDIAHEWTANIKKIRSSFERLKWRNVCEIRYEDLVTQPSRELSKICSFLGEPYDSEMELYFSKNRFEHQEPAEFLQWKPKTIERPTASEVGKYRSELTLKEIRDFESFSKSILRAYNYEIEAVR